jgi:hypothetical protein
MTLRTRSAYVEISTRFPGWHHWPSAPAHRDYLAVRHRHLFHVTASLEVWHDDREVEFHDLLEFVERQTNRYGEELGACSCEHIAQRIGEAVMEKWPDRGLVVAVSEDGENGARLVWSAPIGDGAYVSDQ